MATVPVLMATGILGVGSGTISITIPVAITPTLGADVIVNGTFAADTNWSKGTGWTIAAGVASHAAGTASNCSETVLTIGTWYSVGWTLLSWSADNFTTLIGGGQISPIRSANGTFADAGRCTTDTILRVNTNAPSVGSVDNVSALPITLASMFGTGYAFTGNYSVQMDFTKFDGTPGGVYLQLDSASSPANFVIAYHDGTRIKLDKCVGGTYTNLISSAVTYVAGATIKVIKTDTSYDVYYNGSQVGTTQTISDAGIVAGTLAGYFSTHASNTFANLIIAAV